jgi:isopenicillin N synthase-like dioxygenase
VSEQQQPPAFAVPVVDVAPWVDVAAYDDEARARVARELDAACQTVGFVQVLGHGVPDAAVAGLASAMDDFFGLPLPDKLALKVPANRGYSAPKSESLSLSLGVEPANRMNDFFEAFNVGVEARSFAGLDLDEADYGLNVWPDVAGFRERVEAYFVEAGRVARTLLRVFAAALDLPSGYFEDLTDHSIDVLRMNNYALPPGEITLDGELTGMGEHTDFGLVTVLWADQVAGLQVLAPSTGSGQAGGWHDVSPVDGALLVNLGDLTAHLTNDRWTSTLHRVKPPVVDGRILRRRSAAYFHDGNVDAVVATLPSHVDASTWGGAPDEAYAPVTVRDHIAAKLAGSRQGRVNVSAVREAARVLASRD